MGGQDRTGQDMSVSAGCRSEPRRARAGVGGHGQPASSVDASKVSGWAVSWVGPVPGAGRLAGNSGGAAVRW